MWNFDISQVPRGSKKVVDAGKGRREVFVRVPVLLACRDGKTVTLSHWIEEQSRWNMLAKGEEPLAWMPWPEHPDAE